MARGGQAILLLAGIALAGCATGPKPLEVRAIADPAAKLRAGDLAAAAGQLRLGDVGLALEAFRKIQRDRPSDPRALAGIGDCYSAMGRFDLAQSSYEAALALAPNNPALLAGLAQVFESEGQGARALALRAEAAAKATPVVHAPLTQSPTLATGVGATQAIASKAPLPTASITVSLPPAQPAEPPRPDPAAVLARVPVAEVAAAPPSTLPAPPPLPPMPPLPAVSPSDFAEAAATLASAPRLERLSPGEVALVTSSKPLWRAPITTREAVRAAEAPRTALRWVPVSPGQTRPNVQVLNAARTDGLAASARGVLMNRGWRKIAIGDAPRAQWTSVVLYPKERAALARNLAAQFGVGTRMIDGDQVVLVLGRDKAQAIKVQRS